MKPIKQKKCKICHIIFTPMSSLSKVCGLACALDLAESEKIKKADKVHKQRKKEFYENDTTFQKAKAQKSFNEFIRLRDAKLGCISCEKLPEWHGQWHAGHFKTTAARPDLRFNEDNCHKQCSKCNNFLSGNLTNYRVELIKRIGKEIVDALDVNLTASRYLAEDYIAIYKKYQAKIKELKNNQQT